VRQIHHHVEVRHAELLVPLPQFATGIGAGGEQIFDKVHAVQILVGRMHSLFRNAIGIVMKARPAHPSSEYGVLLLDEIGDICLGGRTELHLVATLQCIVAGAPVLP